MEAVTRRGSGDSVRLSLFSWFVSSVILVLFRGGTFVSKLACLFVSLFLLLSVGSLTVCFAVCWFVCLFVSFVWISNTLKKRFFCRASSLSVVTSVVTFVVTYVVTISVVTDLHISK